MAERLPMNDEERENLVAYLDGELEETAASALEAKLNLDPKTRAEAEQLRRTWDLLDFLPKPEPSPDFTGRTLERVIAESRPLSTRLAVPSHWRSPALGITWAAAVLVAAVVGFGGGKMFPRGDAPPVSQKPSDVAPAAPDEVTDEWVRDLRVMQNRRLYEQVDNLHFLTRLADAEDPDLFGDENTGL